MEISIETILNENEDIFKCNNPVIERLQGGNVNKAYKVTCDDKSFFVRINGKQSDYLSLDRILETEATKRASELKISPLVYDVKRKGDYLVTDYFDGRNPEYEELFQEENIKKFTDILKVIHFEVHTDRRLSLFELIDGYMKIAVEKNVAMPDEVTEIFKEVDKIRAQRSKDKKYSNVFCHNDFWKNNLLIDDKEMVVIDWEMCGYGDAYSDLCHLTRFTDTPESVEKLILKSYFGFFEDEMMVTLQQMKYVGRVLDMVFAFFHFAVQDPMANHDIDYYKRGCDVASLLSKSKTGFIRFT